MVPQHPHDDPERTTALGLARYALEFFETAHAADEKVGMKPGFEVIAPVPILYLMGHSIELVLKAFLVSKGVPLKKLRTKYGHDLRKALDHAMDLGLQEMLQLSPLELSALDALNALYSAKELEYIVTGAKRFPLLGPVESATIKLLRTIGAHVGLRAMDLPALP